MPGVRRLPAAMRTAISDRAARAGWLVLLVFLSLGASATALADDSEDMRKQASARFTMGVELVNEGNYGAALLEFRRAYELLPDWRMLYNIAQVLKEMQDYPGAVDHYERYLQEGGERVAESRREAVLAEVERLKPRVSFLEVSVEQPGAEVLIDDRTRGPSPLPERLAVSMGRRKVTVRKQGFQDMERYVELGGGEQASLSFDLVPLDSVRGESTEGGQQPGDRGRNDEVRKVPWALWGVTGGLAVGAAVTGVLAHKAKGDAEDLLDAPTTKAELDTASNKAMAFGIAADVLTVGAVVVGVFALYRTIKPKHASADQRVSAEVGLDRVIVRARF
jgi:hypothetical protein